MAAGNQENFSEGNQVMEWTHNQSLQRLDMDLTNIVQSQIDQMFEQNPGLRQIKKLFLRNVTSRDVVDRLLDNFTEVEILWLWGSNEIVREFTDDWSFDWISAEWFQTFGKLTHLKNLILHRHQPRYTEGSRPSVRHFTMLQDHLFLFVDYEQAPNQSIEQKRKYKLFVENMAKQFPNLEVLSIMTDIHRFDRFKVSSFPNMSALRSRYSHLTNYIKSIVSKFIDNSISIPIKQSSIPLAIQHLVSE